MQYEIVITIYLEIEDTTVEATKFRELLSRSAKMDFRWQIVGRWTYVYSKGE